MHRPLTSLLLLVSMLGVMALPAAADNRTSPSTREAITYVFNAEGNNLNAYDALTWEKTRVITNATDRPHVEGDRSNGLDINGQICFDPMRTGGYSFVAGEDTGQARASIGGGQGWGYFDLDIDAETLDVTGAIQRGKLEPRYYETTSDNPENYGCGFLSNGDLVTTDVGDQLPHDPASGQLILWFRPDGPDGFASGPGEDGTFPEVPYCMIDVHIPTAGQVHVGEDDAIYVGAQRPDTASGNVLGRPGGIYRYVPPAGGWPTSAAQCTGRHETGRFTGEDADPMVEGHTRETFIPSGPWGLTPSGIVRVPDGLPNAGNFYLSSVLDGRISEFDEEGNFVRPIMAPAPGATLPYRRTGTPLGIGVDPTNGTIYFADLAVVARPDLEAFTERMDPASWAPGVGPGPNGMVRAIRFDADNQPSESIPVNGGLAFPDGIGVVTIERSVVDRPHRAGGAGGRDRTGLRSNASPAGCDGRPVPLPATVLHTGVTHDRKGWQWWDVTTLHPIEGRAARSRTREERRRTSTVESVHPTTPGRSTPARGCTWDSSSSPSSRSPWRSSPRRTPNPWWSPGPPSSFAPR